MSSKIDVTRPHSARVWNYWLGGKDNYPADRQVGDAIAEQLPGIRDVARHSRQFLVRVVTHLAGPAGIDQFLDIGTGLPTMDNTHEVAQRVNPYATIVYVDNDPLVLTHAEALLTNTSATGRTSYLNADVREPAAILAAARPLLDFDRPIAVMLLGILGHATPEFDDMLAVVRAFRDAVPSGSYLVLQDGTDTSDGARAGAPMNNYTLRSLEEFRQCLDGLELLEPGLVPTSHWRPLPSVVGSLDGLPSLDSYGAVARKT